MHTRVVVGIGIILAAMAGIAVSGFYTSREAYYTVDDFVSASGADHYRPVSSGDMGKRLQLRGTVDLDSVRRAGDGLELEFGLAGKDAVVPVVYHGVVPDTFEMADTVTVGGAFGHDGVFVADQLFVQCPSKYEAVPPGQIQGAASP
jgi:cytochrome c-type biogenesis protein CcmE